MENGWICIHRKIKEHWIWEEKPFDKKSAWIDLLLSANHSTSKFMLGNTLFTAEAGDVVTSEQKLAERWGWSRSKVRAFLKMLESDGMIKLKKDSKKTVINIVNFGVYQTLQTEKEPQKNSEKTEEEPQKDNARTAPEQHSNTINNVNNDNNENNNNMCVGQKPEKPATKRTVFHPPTLEEVQAYCTERGNSVDAERFIDYYTANGWKVGRNQMKDWRAAVRNWEKQDAERLKGQSGVRQQGASNQKGGCANGFNGTDQRSGTGQYNGMEL